MDRPQLNTLKRPQLQYLARRERLRGNLKNTDIIHLLLEKYPNGVPELNHKPIVSKSPISTSSKTKQPARRSKRKSAIKSRSLPIKAEETLTDIDTESVPNERTGMRRRRRSMAPPPVTPTASMNCLRRLPTTPLIGTTFGAWAEGETDLPETTPTPPEAAAVTSHQVQKMLRGFAGIIDTTSFDPEEPSSILYRAKTLNTILDTTIVPRMMKIDKEVKDMLWMRAAIDTTLGSQFKENVILAGPRQSEVVCARSDLSFPAPGPPSPKRPREEQDDEGVPPPAQVHASKRTRVQ